MKHREQSNNKWNAYVTFPDPIEIKKKLPRPIFKEVRLDEIESLLQLGLLFREWLEVTTSKNGHISKRICQVQRINLENKKVLVEDQNRILYTIEITNIIGVILIE